jgi:hypothetical protein
LDGKDDDEAVTWVQVIGFVLIVIGLILLYLEISGRKITESKYLGMSGPVGIALVALGAIALVIA